MSPSSRRAWIEIPQYNYCYIEETRRPPRGGRGLKLFDVYMAIAND